MNQAVKIKEGLYWVGALDPQLRKFDVVMTTEWGTSYNSYLVVGEKKAIVETVKDRCSQENEERIESITELKDIDYIILNHTEPDHSGSFLGLLKKCPKAKVVCSKFASNLLKEIANEPFECIVVNDGDTIDLGGKTLQFVSAPFLHWPDSMFTYVVEDNALITGDVYGCHYAAPNVFDDQSDNDLADAQKYYFDVIMGPFKSYILQALEKTRKINPDVICPSHGPVLRTKIGETLERYQQWAEVCLKKNEPKKAFVGYVSCYGYTTAMAEQVAKGLKDKGIAVELYDLSEISAQEGIAKCHEADAIALGSPTLNRDAMPPIWQVLIGLSAFACKGKPAAAFGSYGWSGEAVRFMEERLKNIGAKVVGTYNTKLKPDANALEASYELGCKLAEAIK